MTIQEAIRAAGEGGRIRRKAWKYTTLLVGEYLTYNDVPWYGSTESILAEDWEVVPVEEKTNG